jgi:hypothetical protein
MAFYGEQNAEKELAKEHSPISNALPQDGPRSA